jgi:hypothetical protein
MANAECQMPKGSEFRHLAFAICHLAFAICHSGG